MKKIERNIMAEIGRSKMTGWILNLMCIIMVAMLVLLSYWGFKDYEVLEPQVGNYQLDKDEYKAGEVLKIHFKICKRLPIRERIVGRFVDGVIFSIPDNQSNFDVGCYDTYITGVSIPDTLPAGNYIYEEQVTYKVNPIREITYTFETPRFTVIDSEDCD
jgi:hypothetical protein